MMRCRSRVMMRCRGRTVTRGRRRRRGAPARTPMMRRRSVSSPDPAAVIPVPAIGINHPGPLVVTVFIRRRSRRDHHGRRRRSGCDHHGRRRDYRTHQVHDVRRQSHSVRSPVMMGRRRTMLGQRSERRRDQHACGNSCNHNFPIHDNLLSFRVSIFDFLMPSSHRTKYK